MGVLFCLCLAMMLIAVAVAVVGIWRAIHGEIP
jgi:hypothetical protein